MKVEYLFEVTENITHLCSIELEVPDDEWAMDDPVNEDSAWQELESKINRDAWRDTIVETENSDIEVFVMRDVYEVVE